jgi:hypothetical protein
VQKKLFRGVKYPPKNFFFPNLGILFLGAKLGILPILKAVKRPEEHVMERPDDCGTPLNCDQVFIA